MSPNPRLLQQPTYPKETTPVLLIAMGGEHRTPSPAPEVYPSSARNDPPSSFDSRSNHFPDTSTVLQKENQSAPEHFISRPSTSIPRSKTPTSERIQYDWHGLPSPRTPSCKENDHKEQSTGQTPESSCGQDDCGMTEAVANERNFRPSFSPITPRYDSMSSPSGLIDLLDAAQITPLTSIEGEAGFRESSVSPSTRRSSRLRDKLKTQAVPKSEQKPKARKSRNKHPSMPPQQTDPVAITQAAPAESPFDVAVTSSIDLPALYSAQWQLMYPPGGSTHPAYPWPSSDPRLVFQADYVPLINGLPDTNYVPTLALPVGWHQACWAGLHPIVFDPYRQAFKLTPVGPLPLTSEEIHQGGLQEYVPGGRLHPEYGMLPFPSILSDGSDAEVYNFDGVNWVLPWACVGGFSGFEQPELGSVSNNRAVSTKHAIPTMQLSPGNLEDRYCPDDVFNLQDGWRWLESIEKVPPSTFIPTPGKKWFGTGVHRTTRHTKQPIAALMALTMAENGDHSAERYLGNQNLRNFCPFKSVATPVHVNITLLDDTEFTLVELLSFFPNHYQWQEAGERMIRAGLSATDISSFINMNRRLPGTSVCNSRSVSHYLARKFEDSVSSTETTEYTAEKWTYPASITTDYPLLALMHGLVELPSGVDAGPLTTLISWVRDQGRYQAMLSEVPALLNEAKINGLIDSGEGDDPDKDVLGRHISAMKQDRRRVSKEIQELKEGREIETEASEGTLAVNGTKTKKRKVA